MFTCHRRAAISTLRAAAIAADLNKQPADALGADAPAGGCRRRRHLRAGLGSLAGVTQLAHAFELPLNIYAAPGVARVSLSCGPLRSRRCTAEPGRAGTDAGAATTPTADRESWAILGGKPTMEARMKRIARLLNTALAVALVAANSALAATAVGSATPAAPAASAASAPAAPGPRERPVQSPAVRAAQDATTPGDLRPEHPVVPQITLPLRRARNATGNQGAGSAATGGNIDDSAARCRAAASDREREACTRGGTVPGAPKR